MRSLSKFMKLIVFAAVSILPLPFLPAALIRKASTIPVNGSATEKRGSRKKWTASMMSKLKRITMAISSA